MEKNDFLTAFQSFEKRGAAGEPSWLGPLRREAIARFETLGFPTLKDEEWKYTNIAPAVKNSYRFPFEFHPNGRTLSEIEPFLFGRPDWNRLVFINGVYSKTLSCLSRLPGGVRVGSLKEVLSSHPEWAEPELARHVEYQKNCFRALNTAFTSDGAFVSLAKGQILEDPLHLLFLSSAGEEKVFSQPRNLVLAGEGSRAAVIETYASLQEGVSFTNSVTEFHLQRGASIDHYKIQNESRLAYHVQTTQASCEEESTFSNGSFCFGSALNRYDLWVLLNAEGGNCLLNGLYFAETGQHLDFHTVIDHAKPHGTSHQLYKGILNGKSRTVFSGKIFVRPDAQKTDAHQTNKNLLLSEEATVDAKPQLEILADDVKCTHGAAVGQLEEEAVFYLKSRGLGDEAARNLLTYGFANEVLEKVKLAPLRNTLNGFILERLGHGGIS